LTRFGASAKIDVFSEGYARNHRKAAAKTMRRFRRSRNPWTKVRGGRGIEERADFRWGVAKLVKAPDFDSGIRGFESFLPSHFPVAAGRLSA
jgi:hypothetical protein